MGSRAEAGRGEAEQLEAAVNNQQSTGLPPGGLGPAQQPTFTLTTGRHRTSWVPGVHEQHQWLRTSHFFGATDEPSRTIQEISGFIEIHSRDRGRWIAAVLSRARQGGETEV